MVSTDAAASDGGGTDGGGTAVYAGAPPPPGDAARLALLRSLSILDTAPEERFDHITRTLAALFRCPVALISLVDDDRQWFKSRVGVDVCETSRNVSFCSWLLLPARPEVIVVPDARADERFRRNPLVTGFPHVRFYAGAPLVATSGARLGSLCVIDHVPRSVAPEETALLSNFADMVVREIERVGLESLREQVREHERRLEERRATGGGAAAGGGAASADGSGRGGGGETSAALRALQASRDSLADFGARAGGGGERDGTKEEGGSGSHGAPTARASSGALGPVWAGPALGAPGARLARAIDALEEALLLVDCSAPDPRTWPILYSNEEWRRLTGGARRGAEGAGGGGYPGVAASDAAGDIGRPVLDVLRVRGADAAAKGDAAASAGYRRLVRGFSEAVAGGAAFAVGATVDAAASGATGGAAGADAAAARTPTAVSCRFKLATEAQDAVVAETLLPPWAPSDGAGPGARTTGGSLFATAPGADAERVATATTGLNPTPCVSGAASDDDAAAAAAAGGVVGGAQRLYFVAVVRDLDPAAAAEPAAGASGVAGPGAVQLRGHASPFVDVRLGRSVGRGAYGEVFRGLWDGAPVAVKVIHHRALDPRAGAPLAVGGPGGGGAAAASGVGSAAASSGRGAGGDEDDDDDAREGGFEGLLSVNLAHPHLVQSFKFSTRGVAPARAAALGLGGGAGAGDADPGANPALAGWRETWIVQEFCDRGNLQQACDGDGPPGGDVGAGRPGPAGDGGAPLGLLVPPHTDAEARLAQAEIDAAESSGEPDLGAGRPTPGGWRVNHAGAVGRADPSLVLGVLREIAGGLAYLHGRGIVHGDLSANNVMLSSRDGTARGFSAKVGDFGVSRLVGTGTGGAADADGAVESDAARIDAPAGTSAPAPADPAADKRGPARTAGGRPGLWIGSAFGAATHMPPEVLADGLLTLPCDVYSFGVLCWQLWTCRRPWAGLAPPQIVARVGLGGGALDVEGCLADAPEGVRSLCRDCLNRDPDARPTCADVLRRVMDAQREVRRRARDADGAGAGGGAWAGAAAAEAARQEAFLNGT